MAAATFAEVLDDELGRAIDLGSPETTWSAEMTSEVVFIDFGKNDLRGRFSGYPAPTRPRRQLGPAERHALDELIGLGARLRDDFTVAELRSAFRSLARQHHPDRHPGQSDTDRAHAARIFDFITGHCRCLAAACRS